MKTTKTIAGHEVTLTCGQRYVAGRPIADAGRTAFPITISRVADDGAEYRIDHMAVWGPTTRRGGPPV